MGAGQGIGRAATAAFLREGASVTAVDLDLEGLRDLDGPNLARVTLDATDARGVANLATALPHTSALLNCVGWVAEGTVLGCDAEVLRRSFDINVGSMFAAIQAFLPGMVAREDGSIINIASVASSVSGLPNRFAYATTKAAVIGLTMSVARDFITSGVRCNSISPGTIHTPSLRDRMAATGDIEAAEAAYVARQPMGRLGTADEVAALAVMLASDEARFMTGANLVIDGGLSL